MNNSNFTKQDIAEDDGSYVLSAIVLVYNGLPYLEECINSLVNQTLDNLEILLINDASTDDSLSVCKKFEKMYDNVRLIDKEKNEGLATSANLGISLARGEYIILVDNDDIIPSYAYEKLYNKAKESDEDVCTGKANFLIGQSQFEFDFRENYVWRKEQVIEDVNDFPELFEDAYYWNKIIRKDLLMKHDIKLPIGMIYADRYFAHMAYVYANKVAIIPDCVYLWRQIKSSLSQGRRNTDNYVNRLDSYDLDLDYLIKSCDIYFKMLLRRIIIPIKGILNNSEFEDVVFNRVRFLIKEQEKEFDNLYDNDLNLIDNIYAFVICMTLFFGLLSLCLAMVFGMLMIAINQDLKGICFSVGNITSMSTTGALFPVIYGKINDIFNPRGIKFAGMLSIMILNASSSFFVLELGRLKMKRKKMEDEKKKNLIDNKDNEEGKELEDK